MTSAVHRASSDKQPVTLAELLVELGQPLDPVGMLREQRRRLHTARGMVGDDLAEFDVGRRELRCRPVDDTQHSAKTGAQNQWDREHADHALRAGDLVGLPVGEQ